MGRATDITIRTSVERCIEIINETVDAVTEEYEDVSDGELWTDMAASLLIDAKRETAEEVCRREIGWVPAGLREIWKQREVAEAARVKANQKARYERDKLARDAKRAADVEAAAEAEKSERLAKTCGECFTVRAANGACLC